MFTVSAIYDPLGLIFAVILHEKTLVQRLCRLNIGWDDQMTKEDRQEWKNWQITLPIIENISVIDALYQTILRTSRTFDCISSVMGLKWDMVPAHSYELWMQKIM